MIKYVYLSCLCLLSFSSVKAQVPPPEVPRFSFSICAVGVEQTPELFWLDLEVDLYGKVKREYRPLSISVGSRGSAVEIPTQEPLHLYRQIPTEEGGTRMEPALNLPSQKADAQLLLIIYRNHLGQGQMTFLDDSPAAHPAGTVRVANMSPGRAVAAIGDEPVLIDPGSTKLLGIPKMNDPQRFSFNFAVSVPGQPNYPDPTKLLRFRSPDSRLLVVVSFLPNFETDQNGITHLSAFTPIAYRLYDKVPEPESSASE